MWSAEHGRAFRRLILAALAAFAVSWLGLAALVALSILWPANQVPHVLLGAWLCAIVVYFTWPGERPGRDRGLPFRILTAPLAPLAWAGKEIWRALGL